MVLIREREPGGRPCRRQQVYVWPVDALAVGDERGICRPRVSHLRAAAVDGGSGEAEGQLAGQLATTRSARLSPHYHVPPRQESKAR